MRKASRFRNPDALAFAAAVAWPFVYFWPMTLAQSIWFNSDIIRLYLPFGTELGRALREGRLPLWTPGLQAGFPLLAEGQVGALYPLNLLLFRILPAHYALSYGVLLHLAWAAAGMYLLARSLRFRPAAAFLAQLAFSFNGFILAQIIHPAIVATASWLPWLLLLQEQFQRTRRGIFVLAAALAVGIQFLAGSIQISFLNLLTFCVFGVAGAFLRRKGTVRQVLPALIPVFLVLVLGVGIAAVQLVPTAELISYSVRGGTMSQAFNMEQSLPLAFLSQFALPFPTEPSVSNPENWGYFGLIVLMLAVLAPWLRRDGQTRFLLLVALVALSLTLGQLNPVYLLISRLPFFNFFRAPARYLLVLILAAALLSATAFEELLNARKVSRTFPKVAVGWAVLFIAAVGAVVMYGQSQSLRSWLDAWRVIPWVLGTAFVLLLAVAWRGRPSRETFMVVAVGLAFFDLSGYAAPVVLGIPTPASVSLATQLPRALAAFETDKAPYRVFADESVYPSLPAMRNILFPNLALTYEKESVNIFSPLAFGMQWAYQVSMTPAMLNLLNARYVTVRLEPRGEDQAVTPDASLGLDVMGNELVIPPTLASSIEVSSFTEQAGNLPDGTAVGELLVRLGDRRTLTWPLRLGMETADWDYTRKAEQGLVAHSRAPLAHSFPAYWRAFGRAFEGNTFSAAITLAGGPDEVVGVKVRILRPEVHLTIEHINLYDGQGQRSSLAHLAHKDEFRLSYLSDTAAVWENLDALPRAFLVHNARAESNDDVFGDLQQTAFRPDQMALLNSSVASAAGGALGGAPAEASSSASLSKDRVAIEVYTPENVTVSVESVRPGYLVLADSWYPGWNALVDGTPVPIDRADFVFRSVPVQAGRHTVEFRYEPLSFRVGAGISGLSLLAAAAAAWFFSSWRSKKASNDQEGPLFLAG